ncbi:Coq4 family protein [Caulobacter mirabilis]|uniref:Ubiquinone biosynthesis protein n=1 Tax=Caulobacter mirabilis TaxID=69666 RepID=A0A2D2B0I2_9CAUL|nr:Coq4 family protein [Caulobacter mirabilis]ATQ43772.1 ubiquinone biosynthesis protein [Caulobacter mirabilis]
MAFDSAPAERPVAISRDVYRLQPLRAMRALKRLIADKEDTSQVFEIMRALSGGSIPKGYKRLLSTVEGGRIAYEREEFCERLSDTAWLETFGPGTVGEAYRKFIAPRGLTAEGLAEESRKTADSDIDAAHPFAWYGRRMRDVHDVWHVLTGYGTDGLGEACVVAFSYQQTKSMGFALIAWAGATQYEKIGNGQPYRKAVQEAWRNGKKTAWLPELDYPALFAENLEAARARLGIPRPEVYLSIPEQYRDRPLTGATH